MVTGFDLGVLILAFSALVGWVVGSVILGEIAGRLFGRPWMWSLFFFALPVISHILFAVAYFHTMQKSRAMKVVTKVLFTESKWASNHTPASSEDIHSVTPFDGVGTVEGHSDLSLRPPILNERQDSKVEELIEWGQWGKAHSLIVERLEEARKAGRDRIVEMYQAYLDYIGPQMDRMYGGSPGETVVNPPESDGKSRDSTIQRQGNREC